MAEIPICFVLIYAGLCWGEVVIVEKPFILSGDFNIIIKNGKVHFFLPNDENGEILRGELGVSLSENLKGETKFCDYNQDNCIRFGNTVSLSVEKVDRCYYMNWTTSENLTFEDCIDYGTEFWYGGPENLQQYWPFNNMTYKQYSYVTKQDGNQAVAEPYWVSTSGFYIFVDKTTPLFIDANSDYSNGLCLVAKQSDPYLPRGRTYLGYKICAYDNIRRAHINAVRHELGTPTGIPDKRMIQHPIWSTWVRFKANVNETAVLQFAREIVSNGFNNSQIEIDDNWETCYGSGQFNSSRFQNMSKLSTDLHEMGFRITLWNHPFVNTDCEVFSFLKNKGFLIQSVNGNLTSRWWNGEGGVVDFTNPDAARWFLNERRAMMAQNKIDSIKLDAGESGWLPQIPKLEADIDVQPNAFTVAYVKTVAQFGNMIEIRTGYGTQSLPVFVRMIDKYSNWSFQNGLATLLTTLLQFNLNGYTLVLPDMVGGNAYNEVVDKELFIRWLQANTFMPSIQFSVAPWDFDEETVEISKKFTSLHYAYAGNIIRRMEECFRTGVPVNAPIWWVAPKDRIAHTIWSEFLLGDDILVAPVVEKGATSRYIYLPSGMWRDEADPRHKIYTSVVLSQSSTVDKSVAEFLLGDDILVAPVVEKGATSRDIYLPSGMWRDEADPRHKIYTSVVLCQSSTVDKSVAEFLLGDDILVAPVVEKGATSRDIYLPSGMWRDEADPRHKFHTSVVLCQSSTVDKSVAEFLLGDDILVAPVVEKGATSRDIYLPSGMWRDEADPRHKIYTSVVLSQSSTVDKSVAEFLLGDDILVAPVVEKGATSRDIYLPSGMWRDEADPRHKFHTSVVLCQSSTVDKSVAEFLLGDDILVAPVVEKGATSRDIYLPSGMWRDEADPRHKIYTSVVLSQSSTVDKSVAEFLLGDDILVAPVVEKGATSRDIYLPSGMWRDEADPRHKIYNGQRWLRNYPAPLDTLPFFTRINGCEEF